MKQVINLILSTLPKEVYRDFDHRYKMDSTDHDDLHFTLYVDIMPNSKLRIYYYGENSSSITLHEKYWNGERYESFSDGGFTVDANSITKGKLESWFYRVFRFDVKKKDDIDIRGIDQTLQLIFSTLDNSIMNDTGERHELTVTVCQTKSGHGVDIHYMNTLNRESIWLLEDDYIRDLSEVTPSLLQGKYKNGAWGFSHIGS